MLRWWGCGGALLLSLLPTANARASDLAPGDLIVATRFPAAVICIDPASGADTTVTSGGNLSLPGGVALEAGGTLLVTDANSSSVVRVFPSNGSQSVLTSGNLIVVPIDVEVEADGDILVSSQNLGFGGRIVRVDAATHAQSTVTTFGTGSRPGGLALEPSGQILVTDDLSESVIRVDPTSGSQTTVTSGVNLSGPIGIAFGGLAYVTDASAAVVSVDTTTSQQTVVSSGDNLQTPYGIAIESTGDLVVTDQGMGKIIRVDPDTAGQSVVKDLASTPFGIAVVPAGFPAPVPAISWPAALALAGMLLAAATVGAFSIRTKLQV